MRDACRVARGGHRKEFARVEAIFRAGGDATVHIRWVVLPQRSPRAWPVGSYRQEEWAGENS